jgi:hypothetical protein
MLAQSLACRIVCDLDGTVHLMAISSSGQRAKTNLDSMAENQFLGGEFQYGPGCADPHEEVLNFVPSSIKVHFPRTVAGVVQGEPFYTKTISCTLAGITGSGDTYDLMTLEQAIYPTSSSLTPSNQTTLDSYATTYATDHYNWLTGAINIQSSGIVSIQPDGGHRYEWRYSLEGCSTRAIRETYDVVPWWSSSAASSSTRGVLCAEMSVDVVMDACVPLMSTSVSIVQTELCAEMLVDTHMESCLPTGYVSFFYDGSYRVTNIGGTSINCLNSTGNTSSEMSTLIDITSNNCGLIGIVSFKNTTGGGVGFEYRLTLKDVFNTSVGPGTWIVANAGDVISFDLNSGYRTVNQASSNAWLGGFGGIRLHFQNFKIQVRSTGGSPPDGTWELHAIWIST